MIIREARIEDIERILEMSLLRNIDKKIKRVIKCTNIVCGDSEELLSRKGQHLPLSFSLPVQQRIWSAVFH